MTKPSIRRLAILSALALLASVVTGPNGAAQVPASADKVITEADCTAVRLGTAIPASAIGEPVASISLSAPRWVTAAGAVPAYCSIDGVMTPVDQSTSAKPINFRVALPAAWSRRAAQLGGAGMNGTIPVLTGSVVADRSATPLRRGFVTYGSDSGHQAGRAGGNAPSDWAVNDESIRNFGYLQLKKTHDAAAILIERMYGERPRFTYFFGTSQGGREALTVAQRYFADYDGIVANVPIVGFSSLMLAPELIRIQEKPTANWVTPAKVNAIAKEVIRQCDRLDGLPDGIVNNYITCRAIFDVSEAPAGRNPWAAKRCPNNVDPNPADESPNACLTDGQISTLKMIYTPYRFATPLANGVRSFGMWTPNTDPSGSGLIVSSRFKGQEGAGSDTPMHSHLGVLGVTGFLMRDLAANPLDYVEGGPLNARRIQISEWLDATNPDLSAFARRGGRMIVTIGTNDTLASPGAQLAYYQSVIDKMGRAAVDRFARFFVIPQAGHSLNGSNYGADGTGATVAIEQLPTNYDRLDPIIDWVEKKKAPAMQLTVSAGGKDAAAMLLSDVPEGT